MSQIDATFFDRAFRERWLDEQIRVGLATQIKALRQDRGWSQAELARRCGMAQARISRLEDPTYGRYSIATLKRIAGAFDAALMIRFGPWSCVLTGESVDWHARIPPFDEEFPQQAVVH